ncbi:MAG: hypothetical protein LBV72_12875 [Tannerella sp.]|jgi:hypothetical protein|nr:hypothetical protein [Tannerella sp.]
MKKILIISMLCAVSSVFYNCTNDTIENGEDVKKEDPVTTYSAVETVDFILPPGYRWIYTVPAGKNVGISLINSQEELKKYISGGDAFPTVDFEKKSLLLAYGDTLTNIHKLAYELEKAAEKEEYRLNVIVESGTEAWPKGWTLSALVPKVPENTTIQLNENSTSGNPGEYVNPYRENIAGTWKLSRGTSVSEQDTLDYSDRNITYEFRKDGKLIITGNQPGGLTEGEYSYEYKKLNICPTCSPVPNMRINNGNAFCEAWLQQKTMVISVQKTEQGKTINNYFVRVEDRIPAGEDPDKDKGNPEQGVLNGTRWKLTGIMDVQSGMLTVPETKDCNECYTLVFDAKNSFSFFSPANELGGNYIIDYVTQSFQVAQFGGTKIAEPEDAELYVKPFWTNSIQFFSLLENELKLYYNDKKSYLLFKQQKL